MPNSFKTHDASDVQINWNQIETFIHNLIIQMYRDEFKPDYVIGFRETGVIPGLMIANYIGCPYHSIDYRDQKYIGIDDVKKDITLNKKVLIVNHIGLPKKLYDLKNEVSSDNLRIAVFINDKHQLFDKVDYVATKSLIDSHTSIKFPWELSE